ncbi:MAG TPA: acyclic terpene utilization AtuA family protein [Stellaceae bacterium]|nr:acyclic terpene utilization AtuA family protein [Stellaceae bacterium]
MKIGAGSAWWGDRIEPAQWNAERGELDYLCFETMAEATISAAQVRARRDPSFPGYDTYLDDRLAAVLPACLARGTRVISNQGWINPTGAAERAAWWCRKLGRRGVRVAAVTGGILTERILELADRILETGAPLSSLAGDVVSAEAYLGAEPIVAALAEGADIVLTGRVADPSLFLAPMMHAFGWRADDWDRLGMGSGIGHLMECGAQVTGGYFVDPGYKDVPEPWNLAFPIAEVAESGAAVITKLSGTGGAVDLRTVKEQLFYEVHDPAAYITPDVVVDFTTAKLAEIGRDRVAVSGIGGGPRTATLKVSIGCQEGFVGEDMFFYAGPGALDKARLAKEILERRYARAKLDADELRIDFLGVNAIHGALSPEPAVPPYEVAVRVAARAKTREEAAKIGREIDAMAVSGLGSTGKRVPHQERVREVIGVWSTLVPREAVRAEIVMIES